MERRDFVTRAGALALTAAVGYPRAPRARTADVTLRGALVFDGSGAPPVRADVAVAGDRIAAVGTDLPRTGVPSIELDGLAVAPGFIDIHSHTDLGLLVNPNAESKVRQGVTTEVAGQDGGSIGPWGDDEYESARARYRRQYDVDLDFRDLPGFFARLRRTPGAVNLASMIGAGQVRRFVIGADDRPATPDELSRMQQVIAEALAAGACGVSSGLEYIPGAFATAGECGVSSGLEYIPGAFATADELAALAGVIGNRRLPYASHMRNEDDRLLAAIEEALTIGRMAGVPVQISHLKAQGERNWWKAGAALATIEQARRSGIDVMFDRYPYVAYSTGLGNMFPVWAREGGTTRFLDRLDDPSLADRIETAVRDKVAQLGSWDAVQISSTNSTALESVRGRRLGELAAERGVDPYALLLRITRDDRNGSGMVGFGMSEDNTERILAHPLGMICSDGSALATSGPLSGGSPHPRSYGTFPRLLGHYCRERGAMPMETAIHKVTAMPAARLGFAERGHLTPGAFADLVVFDPDTVRDQATFEAPHQYPAGIPHVMVNGEWAIWEGEHTGARSGRVVRPG